MSLLYDQKEMATKNYYHCVLCPSFLSGRWILASLIHLASFSYAICILNLNFNSLWSMWLYAMVGVGQCRLIVSLCSQSIPSSHKEPSWLEIGLVSLFSTTAMYSCHKLSLFPSPGTGVHSRWSNLDPSMFYPTTDFSSWGCGLISEMLTNTVTKDIAVFLQLISLE